MKHPMESGEYAWWLGGTPTHGTSVHYAQCSAVLEAAHSRTEAFIRVHKAIRFYRELGYPIRSAHIYTLCPACDGNGGQLDPRKRTYNKWRECKKCKGTMYTKSQAVSY